MIAPLYTIGYYTIKEAKDRFHAEPN
jgi:hypothetical protein